MDAWTTVKWSEARQITDLMESPPDDLPEAGVTPQAYYRAARERGDLEAALLFLGQALPRFEGAAWAACRLEELAAEAPPRRADRRVLDLSLRWVGAPSDEHRRAAYAAWLEGEEAGEPVSPERLLAMAVFMSGGSMAPIDLPPVLPPPALSGCLAACVLIVAAHRAPDPRATMTRSLDLGERVAARGLEALPVR